MLLHICCAPCSTATVEAWRLDAVELTGVFFNPNIHPFAEHERRYQTLLAYAGTIGLPLIGEPRYDIKAWLSQVQGKEEKGIRCRVCIAERLRHTAELAAAGGFEAFSTTLSISPFQDHEIIQEEGERAAARAGSKFIYRDLRPGYRRSCELSREAGLYRQRYCGCIFSEEESALERQQRAARRSALKGEG
ncbi:MAG: epoxyqueuosine reductase QueH [Actinobacteria bacterium]|nr:epoxyqueuosine reductase QueH [Actinomycetota bacterium]